MTFQNINLLLVMGLLMLGCTRPDQPNEGPLAQNWSQIIASAKGTKVNLMMWMGDPLINRYMSEYVVPEVKMQYDVDLHISNGQGNMIVSILKTELEAGKSASSIDMMWINGETFFQLRQLNALFGPFVKKLPNATYIDFNNPFIGMDFQQPIDGYECPWGNVQLAIIYDSLRVPNPPKTLEALEKYVQENPGRFTIGSDFTGMTLLKSWMIALADHPDSLYGPFNQETYDRYSARLWEYINRLKPYLWKQGRTFPEAVAPMHQLFANGELDFTMSNNDSEVDNKVRQGLFPETARAYVFDSGTIQNSHYMGIPVHASNPEGAMVVINFLISIDAQLKKMDPAVWGDGTILNLDKLMAPVKARFTNLPTRKFAPDRAVISAKALQELAPEYMLRLYDDFRKKVIEAS